MTDMYFAMMSYTWKSGAPGKVFIVFGGWAILALCAGLLSFLEGMKK